MDEVKLHSFILDKAYQYLARRDHSRQELMSKLERAAVKQAIFQNMSEQQIQNAVEDVLAQLEADGYVDDAKFARHWINSRMQNRPRGRYMLEQELRQKGIERALITSALDELIPSQGTEELQMARRLADKKIMTFRNLDKSKKKQKLTRYLQSKGFAFSVIRQVVDELL